MKRRIYISPYVHGYMDAMDEISNIDSILEVLPRIDTYTITFDYFFQCGVDDFITYKIPDDFEKINFLLKEKTRIISDDKLNIAYAAIEKIFQYYLPDKYKQDKKYQDLSGINNFLQDLLVASISNTSIIRHYDSITDDLLKAKELLPLELFLPIRYLIQSVCPDTINLPYVLHSVGKKDIDRFQKIFEDKPFKEYRFAHGQLDTLRTQKTTALSEIQKKGENLYRRYSGLLNIKKSIISTLSLTTKIVDLTFGKIPGTVADQATKLFTNILEKERRVVIYDYSPLFNEFLNRIKPFITKKKNEN